jgi:hypothetical protein
MIPAWLEFVLTLFGGWMLGVLSAVWYFLQRLTRVEQQVALMDQTLGDGNRAGLIQSVEKIKKDQDAMTRLMVRVATKLGIDDLE